MTTLGADGDATEEGSGAHQSPRPRWQPVGRPPRRRGRTALAVVAAAVLTFAGVLGVAALSDEGDAGPSGAPAPAAAPEPDVDEPAAPGEPPEDGAGGDDVPASAAELEAVVEELSAEVAELRGRPFLAPVAVELLDGEAFTQRLLEDLAEEDAEQLARTGEALVAMGLLEPDTDLEQVLRSFLGEGVLGFYDPETGELVVRGAAVTPALRSTIVHELVHAHDDQHFELHRPEVDEADDERALAFAALVEGNALRVQQAWEATLSRGELAELLLEQLAAGAEVDLDDVPAVVVEQLQMPYLAGLAMVQALVEEGGEARVDEAFTDPPTTSEQVLHPERLLAGEGAQAVALPPADGEVLDQGAYGELMVRLTLESELDEDQAREAAEGWGGDAYVTWADGDATCVRSTFRMDTSRDLRELVAAWEAWAQAHGDAEVGAAPDAVTVTACG